MNKNFGIKKLLCEQTIPVSLRRNMHLPFTEEDRVLWERIAETSFCAMAQNKEVYGSYSHETILREAGCLADQFVNMSRERFVEHGLEKAVEDAFGPESTGVYPVLKRAAV